MSRGYLRLVVAAVVPIVALAIGHWYDSDVLTNLLQQYQATYAMQGFGNGLAVSHLLAGLGAVAVFAALWWSRSVAAAAVYVVAGAFLVLLPALVAAFAVSHDGAAPAAPEPIASFLGEQFLVGIGSGITGLSMTIGGAMVVAGLAVIAMRLRPASRHAALPEGAPQPS